MSARINQYRLDESIRPGVEYLDSFWRLVAVNQRLHQLEVEFAVGVIRQERARFAEKVKANDAPGRRHMLPFSWRAGTQVPIRYDSIEFDNAMRKFADRIAAARRG